MKTKFALVVIMLGSAMISIGQSRVFKEISDDIKSEFRPILQDQSLVGYTLLTQLEKTSEDSFNYKLTIMDENLNDIGIVKFKDEAVSMKGVAFENDLLSLVFVKTKLYGRRGFKNFKQASSFIKEAGACAVVVRFMDLTGKTIKEHQYKAEPDITSDWTYNAQKDERVIVPVVFKHTPSVLNIPGKGFVLFFRDNEGNNNQMAVFDDKGDEMWKKDLAKEDQCYLLTSPASISLLSKKVKNTGHYTLKIMGLEKNSPSQEISLKDESGNDLNILDIGNDPVTNRPYIAGMILNKNEFERYETYNSYMRRAPFKGVYSITITGNGKNDVKKSFSYWKEGGLKGQMTSSGRLSKNKALPLFNVATRDNNGNFYFSGVSLVRKPKWGNITGALITSPLIVPSVFFLGAGTRKVRMEDAVVLKQANDGRMSLNGNIDLTNSRFVVGKAFFGQRLSPYFSRGYSLKGNDAKNSFLILDNPKEITIYNITDKKIHRAIPHKADGIVTQIAPAKEGHIMVYEYNKKEKATKLSIEAL